MKKERPYPPKLALRFFRWYCHPKLRDFIEGDLLEVYTKRERKSGKGLAGFRFGIDVLLLFRPGIIRLRHRQTYFNNWSMYKNYFLIGWRNLVRSKTYSFINVGGLALALVSCILISIYITDELNYDAYHANAKKINRVVSTNWAKMPPALAPQMMATYPHLVEKVVRFWPVFAPAKMRHDDKVFVESGIVFTDPSVFSVFSWPLIRGNPANALADKNSIVLTEKMAEKYFGTLEPIGAQMKFWGNDLTVTGVVKNVPANSHLQFDFLISFSSLQDVMGSDMDNNWGMAAFYTYLLSGVSVSSVDLQSAVQQLFEKNFSDPSVVPFLQPLTSIHLNSDLPGEFRPGGNKSYLFILGTAALFILILASINFANLNTARMATRTKEVGMRKSLGAMRGQLVEQFFGETIITTGIALILGLAIVGLVLPLFNQLAGKSITLHVLSTFPFLIAAGLILLLISFSAGAYPAIYLVHVKPVVSLKGSTIHSSNSPFRKGLIVFQFAVSTFFLAAMVVVLHQLNYMQSKDMGYDSDRIIVLDGDGFPKVQSEFRKIAGVEEVAGVPQLIPGLLPHSYYRAPGISIDTIAQMLHYGVTPTFIETMGIKLVAGRNFIETSKGDEEEAFIVNVSAVYELGWENPEEAIGKPFSMLVPPLHGGEEVWRHGTIVGVVEDFHSESLYNRIEPLVLYPSYDLNLTLVRCKNYQAVIEAMESAWKSINPDAPFNYLFLNDRIFQQYKSEARLGNLIGVTTGLAVTIACLGLLGLVAFSASQRTKEIGIRKVMGASSVQVISLLTKEFIVLVMIAVAIALPLAFYVLNNWINNFAYHVQLSWIIFVLTGIATVLMALITAVAQSFRISVSPVVNSLRSE